MLSIEVPDKYGYVLLTCGIFPTLTNFVLGGKVMAARKKYNVKLPNLYATPGFHEKANEFNRVQRGHQNMLESISDFRVCSLIGGLNYPIVVAVCGVLYSAGAYLYMAGYSDNSLDAQVARLKKGGPIKFLASLVAMGCGAASAISFCVKK